MSTGKLKVSDMQASYKRGCQICSLVYRGIAAAEPDMVKCNSPMQWVIRKDHLRLNRLDKRMNGGTWFLYFHLVADKPCLWDSLEPGPVFVPDFSSDECFALIKSWIANCEQDHKHAKCQLPAATLLPHRIIDVGTDTPSDLVFLYESHGECAQYIALSHCWGTQQSYITTKESLDQRKRGFNIQDVPRTHRDAITCTRKLGVRYLWIDSLCIIQNDIDDWEKESAKMYDIYANAYVTILASSAADDADGFLKTRPQPYCGTLIDSVEGSGQLDINVRREMYHGTASTPGGKPQMRDGPLAQRAWAFQEDILSRRTISYHHDEIVWECSSQLACECGKVCWGPMFVTNWLTQGKRLTAANMRRYQKHYIKPLTQNMDAQNPYEEWRRLISEFTRKRLTKTLDRLPALSGIAANLLARTQDAYLAGIWRNDMQLGLLWASSGKTKQQSVYHAPSFSWASIEGATSYQRLPPQSFSQFGKIQVSLLDGHCTVNGLNPTGAVSEGYIRVAGLVRRTMLTRRESTYHFAWDGEMKDIKSSFFPDTSLCTAKVHIKFWFTSSTVQRTVSGAQGNAYFTAPVVCLIVADLPHGEGSPISDGLDAYYMVVLGLSSKVIRAHERVGMLQLCLPPKTGANWLSMAKNAEVTIV